MSARRDFLFGSECSSVDETTEKVKSPTSREAEWTARDTASVRLQLLGRVLCCRNKPRIRWIRSKGAILVLLWNCLVLDANFIVDLTILQAIFQITYTFHSGGKYYLIVTLIQALSLILLYPLAGWIADVYFGRYQVIKASLWLMWIGTVLLGLSRCINMLVSPDLRWVQIATEVILLPVAVLVTEAGTAGFQANTIPFGIDQLSSGSGDQLGGFITWFVFTTFLSLTAGPFLFSCPLLGSSSDNMLLWLLLQTALLSVALILDSFCRHWLVMEPHTSNPLKLVTRVLNYARKYKEPQFRSAFTYQEDIKPSRVEYAKRSYGGPFSTEQVEDVKTFLRIVSVLIPMGAICVLCFNASGTAVFLSNQGSLSCYAYNTISIYFPLLTVMCIIPMYEFIIHPILHNYIPSMLTRVGIGTIFIALSYVALFTIDALGHRTESHGRNSSMNYTCLFDESSPPQQLSVNPLWNLLPGSLIALAYAHLAIAICEFVFSQSPYNMKGLLNGAIFATIGTFQFLGLVVRFPFYLGYTDHLTTFPTCGSVYTLLLLALTVVWFTVYVFVARSYRKREREETKRQQNYVEDYYSKYLGN